jgi:predicted dehydrogenase
VRVVCDEVAHRAELIASEFGAAAVDGFRALVEREDIDAVLVLSTGWYGSLPVLAACEAGKAVYYAAGLDLESDEVRRLKQRVERSGIAFMAEFPRRQAPATLRLKELIATRLGRPRLLFSHRRLAVPKTANHSFRHRSFRPDIQELVELVDWCRYVVGSDATYVTGIMHRTGHGSPEFDYQMMSLDFSQGRPGTGAVAQISCGRYIPERWSEAVNYRPLAALQVSCEHGIAFVDLPSTLIWFDEAGRHQESLENERPVGEQLLTHFFRAVTSLVVKTSDLEDACRAMFIVEEAHRSYEVGERIALQAPAQG